MDHETIKNVVMRNENIWNNICQQYHRDEVLGFIMKAYESRIVYHNILIDFLYHFCQKWGFVTTFIKYQYGEGYLIKFYDCEFVLDNYNFVAYIEPDILKSKFVKIKLYPCGKDIFYNSIEVNLEIDNNYEQTFQSLHFCFLKGISPQSPFFTHKPESIVINSDNYHEHLGMYNDNRFDLLVKTFVQKQHSKIKNANF